MNLTVSQAVAAQTGRSFSWVGRCLRMGLLSKKLTGLRSKLDDTVGMMGKSSWQGMWWNPKVYHNTMSLFSIGRSLFVQAIRNIEQSDHTFCTKTQSVDAYMHLLPLRPGRQRVLPFALVDEQPASPFFALVVGRDPNLLVQKHK
jgi:hypothetical protein